MKLRMIFQSKKCKCAVEKDLDGPQKRKRVQIAYLNHSMCGFLSLFILNFIKNIIMKSCRFYLHEYALINADNQK